MNMDATQIRDIMEMASKLEGIFRHIRFLCGKYEELQNGGYPNAPYNQYPFIPGGYMPPPNYMQQPYYQQQLHYNYPYETQNHMLPSPNNNFPPKRTEQLGTKTNSFKEPVQNLKTDKSNTVQKKPQNQYNSIPSEKQISTQKSNQIQGTTSFDSKGLYQSPYHIFFQKKKNQIKNQYPQLGEQQLVDIMAEVWKTFDETQRQPYEQQWKRLKMISNSKNKDQKNTSRLNTFEIAKNIKNQLTK